MSGSRSRVLAGRPAARLALDRAVSHLTALQQPAGWWQGELETNVTMDAEDLLLREFLGIRTAEETEAAARWIRSVQRADGTWANFRGGDGDLSTTVEAYVALRLAGDQPEAGHMALAASWIGERGGIAATRVFTRIWLALFGEWPWDKLPVMPPELIYLPRWFPLNVYDWACWARQTIVPLTVVCSLRPVRSLPFGLDELDTSPGERVPRRQARHDPRPTPGGSRSRGARPSAAWTGPCTATSGMQVTWARRRRCGPPPSVAAPTGSSLGRRLTGAGAAFSRPGCTP